MTDLSYYINCGKPWSYDEDTQLRNEYNIEKKTISEIALIHKRRPGGIASRCQTLFNLANRYETRGYDEYVKSDLYKSICETNKSKKEKKEPMQQTIRQSANEQLPTTIQLDNTLMVSHAITDIVKMKRDINEIKEQVGQILSYIKLMYDFEQTS